MSCFANSCTLNKGDMLSLKDRIEDREKAVLAPWAMKSSESLGRVHEEEEHLYRSAYQRDRDRIIHCKAFRRLEYKTQVFLNHEGDHYRTRLTHTLEVAQISRTIARALGLNEDLTEAIALAHDLGHTPFGHSGEEALRDVMAGHGGFEHNEHGLRVVDVLEKRYPDFDGLNLSYELREAVAKHETRWDSPSGAGFPPGPPVLEAQAVEQADSIAYDNHDLDDGLAAGILRPEDLQESELWRKGVELTRMRYGTLPPRYSTQQCIRLLINHCVTDLVENSVQELERLGIDSPESVRKQEKNVINFSGTLREEKEQLENLLHRKLYRDYRVMVITNSARRFIKQIFHALVQDRRQLPPEYRTGNMGERELYRAVCDYVAGMTDRYAQDLYLQMFHPYQKL